MGKDKWVLKDAFRREMEETFQLIISAGQGIPTPVEQRILECVAIVEKLLVEQISGCRKCRARWAKSKGSGDGEG